MKNLIKYKVKSIPLIILAYNLQGNEGLLKSEIEKTFQNWIQSIYDADLTRLLYINTVKIKNANDPSLFKAFYELLSFMKDFSR